MDDMAEKGRSLSKRMKKKPSFNGIVVTKYSVGNLWMNLSVQEWNYEIKREKEEEKKIKPRGKIWFNALF